MFGVIVDILVKHDSDRERLILLFVKILVTASLSFHLFPFLFGPFEILQISDFQGIVRFFLNGQAVLVVGTFYFLWFVFFDGLDYLLTLTALWSSVRLLAFVEGIVKGNHQNIVSQLERSKFYRWIAKIYLRVFISIDVIDIHGESVRAGKEFYRFYTYLWELENESKRIDRADFSDTLLVVVQFIFLWQFLTFPDSISGWVNVFVFGFSTMIIILNFCLYLLVSFIAFKHHKLLGLMMFVEPGYDPVARKVKTEPTL